MADYAQRVKDKIVSLAAEIDRVKAEAQKTVTELQGQIALLKKVQTALTPDNEALLAQLKTLGFF